MSPLSPGARRAAVGRGGRAGPAQRRAAPCPARAPRAPFWGGPRADETLSFEQPTTRHGQRFACFQAPRLPYYNYTDICNAHVAAEVLLLLPRCRARVCAPPPCRGGPRRADVSVSWDAGSPPGLALQSERFSARASSESERVQRSPRQERPASARATLRTRGRSSNTTHTRTRILDWRCRFGTRACHAGLTGSRACWRRPRAPPPQRNSGPPSVCWLSSGDGDACPTLPLQNTTTMHAARMCVSLPPSVSAASAYPFQKAAERAEQRPAARAIGDIARPPFFARALAFASEPWPAPSL